MIAPLWILNSWESMGVLIHVSWKGKQLLLTLPLLEGFILWRNERNERAMRELLQIGEIARLVGVSTKTIRYYHEITLLPEPERTGSGYRLYTAQHLLRLQRIRRLRALGLSLERIREILNETPEKNESTLRAALHSLVEETTAQILELEEVLST